MKKIYLISIAYLAILFFSLMPAKTHAQVYAKDYLFTPLSGTFTELIGGTAFTAVQSDDILVTTPINIGFNFNYCGVVYTTIRAGSNGIMCFSATSSNSAANSTANFASIKPGLMWLWDDLDGATGTATYATTGTAPNRVFTFQYKNWEWFWNATGPNITVQVKLFETTNIIEYHYRQESQPGTPNSASIGIVDQYATPTYLSLNNSGAAPTASSTTFTTSIAARPANGQIYRFAPPPDCSNSILPTAGTTAASPVNICNNWNTNLTFTPNTAMPNVGGITYRWQTATNVAGPWTNIPGAVTTAPNYTTGALTANAYFRTEVLCNNSVVITSTPSAQVVIATFTSPTVTNGVRCGSGTVNLSASSPGNIIRWYQNATGGIPIQTGNNYTTPIIAANTNYYVTAGNTGSIDSLVLGAGGSVTASGDYTTIFSGGWGGYKHQFLITQAELAAIGILPGNIINSIGVTSTNGGTTYTGFTLSLLPTNSTALTTTFEGGATDVYGPLNYTTTTGLNNFVLTTGYTYTGGNLIIQTCWSNNTASNPYHKEIL